MSARERRAKARRRANTAARTAIGPAAIAATAAFGLAGPLAGSAQAAPLSVGQIANLNTNPLGAQASELTAVGSKLYFTAASLTDGTELFTTTGAPSSTALVDDINPGVNSSYPSYLTNANGHLFFTATNAAGDEQLWTSNGTAASTLALTPSLGTATTDDATGQVANIGSTAYALSQVGNGPLELTASDGTVAGTTETNLGAIVGGADLTAADSELYFIANGTSTGTTNYPELWVTNGTAAPTQLTTDETDTAPADLTNVDGKLYFTQPENGDEQVYSTNGTALTTLAASTFTSNESLGDLTAAGSDLYFTATTNGVSELEVTNGSLLGGATALTNLGASYFGSGEIVNVNGTVYFSTGYVTDSGPQLGVSNGTTAGTTIVNSTAGVSSLVNDGGTLYFAQEFGYNGLWRSNGTANGTTEVAALSQGIYGLTNGGSELYFDSFDAANGGNLWSTNGTVAGTQIADPGVNPGATQGSDPGDFTDTGHGVFFSAEGTDDLSSLWVTNGNSAGTTELSSGSGSGLYPEDLTNVKGTLFFSAASSGSYELWESNGTAAGTHQTAATVGADPTELTNAGGLLYLIANGGTVATVDQEQLWVTNGTSAGTAQLTSFSNANVGISPTGAGLTAAGAAVYFDVTTPNGEELWRSSGTTASTLALTNSASTSEANLAGITDPSLVGTAVYFLATSEPTGLAALTGSNATDLWVSNGTAAGTASLKQVSNNVESGTVQNVNGAAVFVANGELWASNGTANGTAAISNAAGDPSDLTTVNGELYFSGTNASGLGLWESNGTANGTALVDIPDAQSTVGGYINDLANDNGLLVFAADDGTHGHELWSSNGTTAGTAMVSDIHPGAASGLGYDGYSPDFTNSGSALFFAADDGTDGVEPWSSGPSAVTPVTTPTTTTTTPTPTTPVKTPVPVVSKPVGGTKTVPKVTLKTLKASGDTVSVTLSCPTGTVSCKVRGVLEVVEKLKGKQLVAVAAFDRAHKIAPKTHYKTVILSSHTITLKPGKKVTLKLTLDRTGVALLKARHRLSTKLLLSESGRVVATRTVKLTAPKVKVKKK